MAENGQMPRLVDAPGEMPPGAVRASRVISSVVRMQTARHLRRNPGSTRQEIASATGLNYNTLRHEIGILVEIGYVTSPKNGRNEAFTFDGQRFSRDLGELVGFLSE